MATELGQAYVQIMPSAKGISGAIQKELDPEATLAGKSAGSKLASMLKSTVVAAGIGKFIGATLMEGGALQQSLGGVETLFKDNADRVKAYAKEAYKTSGLSANAYMENVTSFSASLLQSLGGDTQKAADVANMAMIDMSDNANKMGTDMQSIQNAYQGFAKQNYTMLDNLKLGYGGTKTEMERLLSDATRLSGVKYNIDNLSDVYNAVHIIQEELGITGTTAKEAAETFSGSLAAMKAALSNFLGNLALGEDLKPSLQALAETASTFIFNNLLPMILNIITALPGAVAAFISDSIPYIFDALSNLITQFAKWLNDGGIPELLEAIGELTSRIITEIGKSTPKLLEAIGELAIELAKGFILGYPAIDKAISDLIWEILAAIGKGISKMFEAGGELVISIGEGIKDKAKNMYEEAKEALAEMLDEIGGWKDKFFEAGANIVESIADGIKSAVKKVTDAIGDIVGDVRDFLPFSPAKRGPLRDLNKLDFGIIADGIYAAENPITTAMNELAQSTMDSFNPYGNLQTSIAVNRSMVDTAEQSRQMIDKMGDNRTPELLEILIQSVQILGQKVERIPDRQQALARE